MSSRPRLVAQAAVESLRISSTPVGFVTAKGSPIAKALSDAVNELIANGDYTKILAKWGVAGTDEITKSRSTRRPPSNPRWRASAVGLSI
jgi:ABC-type amino acid transport substrate-binding protein